MSQKYDDWKHDGDMSDYAVKRRYDRANEMAIVTTSTMVFQSLMDVPRLLEERKKLYARVEELEGILKANDINF